MSADDMQEPINDLEPTIEWVEPPSIEVGTFTPPDELAAQGIRSQKVLAVTGTIRFLLPFNDEAARQIGENMLKGTVEIASSIPPWMQGPPGS